MMNINNYMNRQKRAPLFRGFVLGVSILAFSACSSFYVEEPATPHIVKIQKRTEAIQVGGGKNKNLTGSEIDLVNAFSDLYLSKGHGFLIVNFPKKNTAKLRENLAAIYDRLLKQGVDRTKIQMQPIDTISDGKPISIVFEKYTVAQPDCLSKDFISWDSLKSSYRDNRFGCAYVANLAMAVTDPYDFINPAKLGPSDATRRSKVLEDYRTNGNSGAKAEVKAK